MSGANRTHVASLVGKEVNVTYTDKNETKEVRGKLLRLDGRLAELTDARVWIPNIREIKPVE